MWPQTLSGVHVCLFLNFRWILEEVQLTAQKKYICTYKRKIDFKIVQKVLIKVSALQRLFKPVNSVL